MWEAGDDDEVSTLQGLGNISQEWGDTGEEEEKEQEKRLCQAQSFPVPLEACTREFSGKTEVWNSLGGDKIPKLVHGGIGSGNPRSFWFHVVPLLMVLQHVPEHQWDTWMSR